MSHISGEADDDGVYNTLGPATNQTVCASPRVSTWTDRIAALRRGYMKYGAKTAQEKEGDAFKALGGLKPAPASTTAHVYTYTRGVDLTNDDLGYGVCVRERLDGPTGKRYRSSQMTKTGRQQLSVSSK